MGSKASDVSIWPDDLFQASSSASPWESEWSTDPRVMSKFQLKSHQPVTTDVLRRACMAMYKPGSTEVLEDGTTRVAPFSCRQDSGLDCISMTLSGLLVSLSWISSAR